jgi:hypothetical protein
MRAKWISFLLVLVISGSLSPHASAQAPAARRSPSQRQAASLLPTPAQKFAPDRILVRFRAVASKAAIDGLHARQGVAEIRLFSSVRTLQVVRLLAGASLEKTLSQ